MLLYWIWLTVGKYISAKSKKILLERFGDVEQIFLADEEMLRGVDGLKEKEIAALADKSLALARGTLRTCDDLRVQVITWQDAAYPERLRNIYDPPLVLYVSGNLPSVDNEAAIAVVGTRKASAYGLMMSKRLGYQLSRAGAMVISGAARGIDSMALEGALTAGRPVIGVLGCGTDIVYPPENRSLLRDIRLHGCLISEYPPGTSPKPEHFPARNRIMSGLAVGVLVVEAPKKSGALITAKHALEQGKDIFAIPGNVGANSLEGNIALIKEGATMVECGADIVREYVQRFPKLNAAPVECDFEQALEMFPKSEVPMHYKSTEEDEKAARRELKKKQSNPEKVDPIEVFRNLTENQMKIMQAVQSGSRHIDELIELTGLTASAVLGAVTAMEIKGYIKRLPGQRFKLPGLEEPGDKLCR